MKIRFYLLVIICCVLSSSIYGQNNEAEKKSNWKGFDRLEFQFNGRKAQITKPSKPLPGNPWLWRARFPDYHEEIDSTLLAKGFHVAYINTDNQFGSPKAIAVWNQFYKHVTETYKMNAKVALHGHSRGGLFIYN
jgi:sialidase-1